MACRLCGDEGKFPVYRYWSPDDGWEIGRLCPYCTETELPRRPKPDDYAWEKRGEYTSDEDGAIDAIYG